MDKYTPFVVQDTDILGVKCYFIACYAFFCIRVKPAKIVH